MLLSTLQSYVEAMGGRLTLVAEFPGRLPVRIKGLAMLAGETNGFEETDRPSYSRWPSPPRDDAA